MNLCIVTNTSTTDCDFMFTPGLFLDMFLYLVPREFAINTAYLYNSVSHSIASAIFFSERLLVVVPAQRKPLHGHLLDVA